MKQVLFVLPILLAASCTKEAPCPGASIICTHTIYYGYRACPDPKNSDLWHFSECQSYTETFEMCERDTSAWLLEARAFDESRKSDQDSQTWEAFVQLYPNECGCK